MVGCKKAYHKKYYAKNRGQILARQKRYRTENAEILKSRRKYDEMMMKNYGYKIWRDLKRQKLKRSIGNQLDNNGKKKLYPV